MSEELSVEGIEGEAAEIVKQAHLLRDELSEYNAVEQAVKRIEEQVKRRQDRKEPSQPESLTAWLSRVRSMKDAIRSARILSL